MFTLAYDYLRTHGHLTNRYLVATDGLNVKRSRPAVAPYKPYWQARKADRKGIGLGLAITKGIVEAHGGMISVESSAAGTTFTVSLPMASAGLAAV
jgi:light-regulated signal transduction histidine kinase (bacteriophytochrome)